MLPDWVSIPGPLTYESGALPIALSGPARSSYATFLCISSDNPLYLYQVSRKYLQGFQLMGGHILNAGHSKKLMWWPKS